MLSNVSLPKKCANYIYFIMFVNDMSWLQICKRVGPKTVVIYESLSGLQKNPQLHLVSKMKLKVNKKSDILQKLS